MVVPDDPQALAPEERNTAEQLLPEHCVRLHQPRLGIVQRRRFLQDAVGDADLADVVEQEAVLHALVPGERGVDRPRQLHRVALNALRMRPRSRVLRLEGARKCCDGLPVGLLEQEPLATLELEELPEVARVEKKLLVDRPVVDRTRRRRFDSAREPLDDRQECERAEGFPHERVGARLLARPLRAPVLPREEHDRDLARLRVLLHRSAESQAVHARHANVEDDDVRPACLHENGGGGRSLGFVELHVHGLEGRAEECSQSRIVVDQ